ncbi:LOW QUALITY PROTEIN: hypothetical protein V2J09_003652 [Rumex salicifolius]
MQTKHVDCEISAPPKQKERRIVTWTPEEDDILREQISIHGTDNWTIIASKFKDKTTRQCRRRWYTYLNSDFKKGGWSPEEDVLLCEAQKVFGNRWTEIAKVVSGRTDNAVKNRFTTLSKKRAKCEALAKENSTKYTNANNKRPNPTHGLFQSASPLKKMRIPHIPNLLENCNIQDVSDKDCMIRKKNLRSPLTVISQNGDKIDTMLPQHQATTLEALIHGSRKFEGFLKNGDPKILALMQQAELFSSLAVNAENIERSSENVQKILESLLIKSKDSELSTCSISDMDLELHQLKDLFDDSRSCNTENQTSQRQPDFYDSPSSSEHSTGSCILSTSVSEQIEQNQSEMCTLHENSRSQKIDTKGQNGVGTSDSEVLALESINQDGILLSCAEPKNDGDVSAFSLAEFSSPLQTTPLFSFLAGTIPSPQFSEREALSHENTGDRVPSYQQKH